jgi:hypothetical protein
VISDGFPYLGVMLPREDVSCTEKINIQSWDFQALISLIVDEYQPLDVGSTY